MELGNEYTLLARDPRPAPGTRVPLFDRLTAPPDLVRESLGPSKSLDAERAIESVRTDLMKLLNSRTTSVGPEFTTLNFGLPDFSHVSAVDMQARYELAQQLTRIIAAFEPRLSDIRVNLDPHRSGERYLAGVVTGVLRMDMLPEPVSFQLVLPGKED